MQTTFSCYLYRLSDVLHILTSTMVVFLKALASEPQPMALASKAQALVLMVNWSWSLP